MSLHSSFVFSMFILIAYLMMALAPLPECAAPGVCPSLHATPFMGTRVLAIALFFWSYWYMHGGPGGGSGE